MNPHDAQLLRSGLSLAMPGRDGLRVGAMRALVAMGAVILSLLVLWPTTITLIERWQDTVHRTYTHGALIVLLTLWLLWRGRSRWQDCEVSPAPWAAIALVVLGLQWLIAMRAGLQIVHQALLPMMVVMAVTACFGLPLLRRMWLPLLFLYFAIPVWDAINPLLQWISVFAVRVILRVADIPVYFAGNTFHIPSGSFEIAGGCSGLHFFVVAAAIGVLHGEIERDSPRTRIALVVLACVLAMITNWVRVFIIVLAGHLTDMQHYLVSGEHYSFGWFMFAGTMVVYFLITRRWIVNAPAEPPPAQRRAEPAVPRTGVLVALAALCVVPAWNHFDDPPNTREFPPLLPPTPGLGDDLAARDWQPRFAGADHEQRGSWIADGTVIEGYSSAYGTQRQGKELVGYENSIYGPGWNGVGAGPSPAPWVASRASDSRGNTWLFWRAYRLDDHWHSRSLPLQLDYAVRSLSGAPIAGIIVLRARCSATDCASAQQALEKFTTEHWRSAGSSR